MVGETTYVCTVTSADDQATIQHKLHVTGTTSLSTSGGDVLADVGSRADDLCLADIVVFQEDNLEEISNIRIGVHDLSNLADQVNDGLRHPVTGSSLASENRDTRLELLTLLWRHLLDGKVAVNDTENVQLLTLVLVDTLDLHIKKRLRVDTDSLSILDVLGKADLVCVLDLLELLAEVGIVDECLNLVQERKILQVLVAAKLRGNEFRQARVGLVEPATGCDAVGNIGELVWTVDLHEILENGGLDQIRVQLGDTVDLVRANDGEICHADHLGLRLLNDGHASEHIALLGEGALNELQELQVDVVDDLQVTRQQVLEKRNGPLLESLGQDGVVGVAEGLAHDVPGIIPVKALNIDENSLQLRNRHGRVRVIKLDGDLGGEVLPSPLGLLEAADNVV